MNQAEKLIYEAPGCRIIHWQPGQLIAASPLGTVVLFSILDGSGGYEAISIEDITYEDL
jgi:hypothetical protein